MTHEEKTSRLLDLYIDQTIHQTHLLDALFWNGGCTPEEWKAKTEKISQDLKTYIHQEETLKTQEEIV